MAIKVIVELRARPGRRDELQSLLENMIAAQGSNQHGFLGSTRYEVLDDADLLVEIADWESAEARMAHMQEAVATGAYNLSSSCWPRHSGLPRSGSCPDRTRPSGGARAKGPQLPHSAPASRSRADPSRDGSEPG